VGTFNTLGTIIGIVSPNSHYSDSTSSTFGALFIVGGIVGCALFGILAEKFKCYKILTVILTSTATLWTIL